MQTDPAQIYVVLFLAALGSHIVSLFALSGRQDELRSRGRSVTKVKFFSLGLGDRLSSGLLFLNLFDQGGAKDPLFVFLIWLWRASGLLLIGCLIWFATAI
jgi:hypothetical protein